MCGICGTLTTQADESATGPVLFGGMMDLMARRGPDDSGYYAAGPAALGFRRLSILDLTPAGSQPMVSADGNFVLVFNGELFNFQELRPELERAGYAFRSSGDAEVVLYAFAHWGRQALDRFNGMFALAFYDAQKQRLLLARDHAGIKPLYYLLSEKGLFFASQYDQILQHPWSQGLSVSADALSLYLSLGYIPAPYAILERTFMLEPGTFLEFDANGSLHRERYFSFPKDEPPTLHGRDALEQVDEVLSGAVKRQMVSDVPLGVFLSGGIDSPLVAARAVQAGGRQMPAFTIAPEVQELDESGIAARYARILELQHVKKVVAADDVYAMLREVVDACAEPFADSSIFPTLMVSRLAREHGIKVVLSGDGGDELFWGYVSRFSQAIRAVDNFRNPFLLRKLLSLAARVGQQKANHRLLRARDLGHWYFLKHSRLRLGRNGLFPNLSVPADFDGFAFSDHRTAQAAQWVRWNEYQYHLPMMLMKVDRASMYHSLEVRVPLLDRQVVDLASKIDWQAALDLEQGRGKIPLRYSLDKSTGYQSIYKRGFEIPMGDWLRGELRSLLEDLVLSRTEFLGFPVNQKGLRRLYAIHLDGRERTVGLWVLLSLALWQEKYMKGRQI